MSLELKNRGHDVTVLTGMPNYPSGKLYDGYSWFKNHHDMVNSISVYRVPIFLRRESKSWQLALNFISFVVSACLIAPFFLRKKKFDIVFTFGPSPATVAIPAIMLAKVKGARMLFWVQDLWPDAISATGAINSKTLLAGIGFMTKLIYKGCDHILVQSKSFINPVVKAVGCSKKVSYFPNWAEQLYKPVLLEANALERKDVPSNGFVVMFAGNLGFAQSLETIVSAAEVLAAQNIFWVFLGGGRKRKWLEDVVVERGLNKIIVLGSRPTETMPAYFSLASAMLVTLKNDPLMSTTIPSKLQSYLACGKPIIGALNGAGAAVIKESHAGYCVEPGDAEGLASAVKKMSLSSEQDLKKMSVAAINYYQENFNRSHLVSVLEGWMMKNPYQD